MKTALAILAATMALTACRHAEVARQQPTDSQARIPVNPSGHFAGRRPTEPELQSYSPLAPTQQEFAADLAIIHDIVGVWSAADESPTVVYPVLSIRANGTFTVSSKQRKLLSKGVWSVDRGVLLLKKKKDAPDIGGDGGFHVIDLIDDHRLVCGIGVSVAGRLKFTK